MLEMNLNGQKMKAIFPNLPVRETGLEFQKCDNKCGVLGEVIRCMQAVPTAEMGWGSS